MLEVKPQPVSGPARSGPQPGMSIAEAARRTGVSAHTLRYYERAGLVVTTVDRTAGGRRRDQHQDPYLITVCTKLRPPCSTPQALAGDPPPAPARPAADGATSSKTCTGLPSALSCGPPACPSRPSGATPSSYPPGPATSRNDLLSWRPTAPR